MCIKKQRFLIEIERKIFDEAAAVMNSTNDLNGHKKGTITDCKLKFEDDWQERWLNK